MLPFQNPNKAANSFNNLFGDSGPEATHAKGQGKGELQAIYTNISLLC